MRSGLRTLVFYVAVWLFGACGCLAVNIATNGQAHWYEHAAFLLISAMGFAAGCWHVSLVLTSKNGVSKPEKSLLLEEHSLRALKTFTDSCAAAGIAVCMISVVFFMVRAMSSASYLSALWPFFVGMWIVVTTYLIEMWRLQTLGEVCGWDTAPKK